MQALILAGGYGTRMGKHKETPKAMLPLGHGRIIDMIVSTLWTNGIDRINILHNSYQPPGCKSWAAQFKAWKKGLISKDTKSNRKPPYIKLISNGINRPSDSRGSAADLYYAIERINPTAEGLLVLTSDDIVNNIHLHELINADASPSYRNLYSAITVRPESVVKQCLEANPSRVSVVGGRVHRVGDSVENSPWYYCGPMYLSIGGMSALYDFVSTQSNLDSLGDFVDWAVVEKREEFRAVKVETQFFTVGNADLYKKALNIFGKPGMVDQSLAVPAKVLGIVKNPKKVDGK